MWFFYSALQSVLGLKRKCGECGKVQIVPVANKDKAAKCRYCGAKMPVPRADSSSRKKGDAHESSGTD